LRLWRSVDPDTGAIIDEEPSDLEILIGDLTCHPKDLPVHRGRKGSGKIGISKDEARLLWFLENHPAALADWIRRSYADLGEALDKTQFDETMNAVSAELRALIKPSD
jgi:hypothetical protein